MGDRSQNEKPLSRRPIQTSEENPEKGSKPQKITLYELQQHDGAQRQQGPDRPQKVALEFKIALQKYRVANDGFVLANPKLARIERTKEKDHELAQDTFEESEGCGLLQFVARQIKKHRCFYSGSLQLTLNIHSRRNDCICV